jgi:hypothetical protein
MGGGLYKGLIGLSAALLIRFAGEHAKRPLERVWYLGLRGRNEYFWTEKYITRLYE